MTFQKPDSGYWDRKCIAYLHDPLDKVFRIQGHEDRAAQFLEKYGLQKPNEEFWKAADGIAAGFERGQVPSHSADPLKNGAVDFLEKPVITHPTSTEAHLAVTIPKDNADTAASISQALLSFMEQEIGMKAGQGGYSDQFKGDEARFAAARFLYTHLVLRFKLAEGNVGGLGGFWHRVPADSRFPDHSIWQHNALCSAINSCIELGKDRTQVGLMVFSITPVQPFIAKARKLRDYWTGSVLLSWLSFEGMRWVIENLGPDHVLYPSLIDQPLVNAYLKKQWEVTEDGFLNPPKDIASFPNKFLFLVPMNLAESIAGEITARIRETWSALCDKVCDSCVNMLDGFLSEEEKTTVKDIFKRQNSGFWDLQWAAAFLATADDREEIENLLPETVYQDSFSLLESFNRIIADKPEYDKSGMGVLYSVSHSLVQSALAASKNLKHVTRPPEPGEKCHLCGEFEVLHHIAHRQGMSADEYKKNVIAFWKELKKRWDGEEGNNLGFNLNENEKLCSICLTKRMACEAIGQDKDHILYETFKGKKGFASTTEIALHDFYQRKEKKEGRPLPNEERKNIAQQIHEKADEKTDNQDRYYAILAMDGDKMGSLVNGATLASTWKSIMHPDIVERLKKPEFEKKYRDNWKDIFGTKRLVTPAIHAAISECLGDFSLYGVPGIIKKHGGTLIYAGGDDVCAVLPVTEALAAAREIRDYYISTYKWIQRDKGPVDVSGDFSSTGGKLSINLGKGADISISAGLLICHHKESLTQMISGAQSLLKEKAKHEEGRNACAIELRKRSGGSRFFARKWNQENVWKSFSEIGTAIKDKNKAQVSSSVVYRLEGLRDGVEAILERENWKEMLTNLIANQLERSSVGDDDNKEALAAKMADLVVKESDDGKRWFMPEGLIIAAFMAEGGTEDEED